MKCRWKMVMYAGLCCHSGVLIGVMTNLWKFAFSWTVEKDLANFHTIKCEDRLIFKAQNILLTNNESETVWRSGLGNIKKRAT